MARPRNEKITIQNVRLMFKNFAGNPDRFNKDGGKRYFSVVLPEDVATDLIEQGWNIRELPPREENGSGPLFLLKVNVNFNGRPPRIVLLSGRSRTTLTEDLVSPLDWAEMTNVDITFHSFVYNEEGNKTAYLDDLYVTTEPNELEQKYADYEPDAF